MSALGVVFALATLQYFQIVPFITTSQLAPQCETLFDYFSYFIYYLVAFGNKLLGFILPINM